MVALGELESRTEHIKALAEDLLDDIELNKLSTENLLLKATRLARFIDAPEIREWLNYELRGYEKTPVGIKYMGLTGRWIDKEKGIGYWWPLAQIEAYIDATRLELATLRTPDVSCSVSSANPSQYVPTPNLTTAITMVSNKAAALSVRLQQLGGIRSKTLSLLHNMVTSVYYEILFSGLAESIFESFKKEIDALLATRCGPILEQVPAVSARLAEGDREAVSQALNTCRRIIDSFADEVFPPSDTPLDLGDGKTLNLGASNHLNRIYAYVHNYCSSNSRKKAIRHSLRNLYERVSAGVHADVTPEEARTLFIKTYVLLGEIILLSHEKTDSEKPSGSPR